ncbi:MAG: hypothetical protein FRX48_01205 [Lasallia pustulata]|uniref:Kinetochore protein fta7 n=1 Tax=Lasallia pustulata TaxID=136370 RepID=A0A5M8Q0E9_9LECA|nr:MAG: hypothetical protein FRX48_01205 [Lasallia pustulata]
MAKRKSGTGRHRRRKSSAAVLQSPREQSIQASSLINDTALGHDPQSPLRTKHNRASTLLQGSSSPLQASKKRKRTTAEDTNADDAPPRTKFAALKPRVKYVPQRVIRSQWRVLPEVVQYKVKEIFRSLERPVITSHRDEGKRTEAQIAVASITRTLGRRLPRMPFPPDTKEIHFNYEALLDSNRGLEAHLDRAIHSAALYKGEIEQEQHLLAEEKQNLEALEKNARTEESLYRRQASKCHKLLQSERVGKEEDGLDAIGFIENVPGTATHLNQQHLDAKLKPVVVQLRNHLDSMQSNTAEIKGISEALIRAEAVLDDLLYCHIDRQHYAMVASAE